MHRSILVSMKVNKMNSETSKFALQLEGMVASTLHLTVGATEIFFTGNVLLYSSNELHKKGIRLLVDWYQRNLKLSGSSRW